jgi:hypothetical protein
MFVAIFERGDYSPPQRFALKIKIFATEQEGNFVYG